MTTAVLDDLTAIASLATPEHIGSTHVRTKVGRRRLGLNTAGDPVPSLAGELERLVKLHSQGALSDQEFQAVKRRLTESG